METMLATTTSQMRSIGKSGSIGKTSTHKISTRVVNINPEMAADLLKFNTRNRALNQRVVMDYATQMQKGLWQLNGEPIILSDTNLLLDGQTRLHAIIKSGTTQQMLIVTGVPSNAFRTIDTGYTRTAGNILGISGIKNSNELASVIAREFVLSANSSIWQNHNGIDLRRAKVSKQEILDEYEKTPELYDEIIRATCRFYDSMRIMYKSEAGAYMAYLIREKNHNKERVFSFFKQLFTEDGVENKTIHLLRKKLLQSITGQYKMSSQLKKALITKTWNCYITGRELSILNFNPDREIMPEFI